MENKINNKTLIVEDAPEVFKAMEIAFRLDVFGESEIWMSEDSPEKLRELGLDVAQTYYEAKKLIGSRNYNFVLLDHNLPRTAGGEMGNIGYGLIPEIRQRNLGVVIIGTSSNSEVRGQRGLDYVLDKTGFDFGKKLGEIYNLKERNIVVKGGVRK